TEKLGPVEITTEWPAVGVGPADVRVEIAVQQRFAFGPRVVHDGRVSAKGKAERCIDGYPQEPRWADLNRCTKQPLRIEPRLDRPREFFGESQLGGWNNRAVNIVNAWQHQHTPVAGSRRIRPTRLRSGRHAVRASNTVRPRGDELVVIRRYGTGA